MIRKRVIQQHEATLYTVRFEALLTATPTPAHLDTADELPPAMPPMAILDAMIDPYFDQISPIFPLWTKQGLRAQIASYQAGHTACAVSANNVILLTLMGKFAQTIAPEASQLSLERTSSTESELAAPFVLNARRAAKNTNKLLTPNLPNIQALLSLVRPAYTPGSLESSRACISMFEDLLTPKCPPVLDSVQLSSRRDYTSIVQPGSMSLEANWARGYAAGSRSERPIKSVSAARAEECPLLLVRHFDIN